MLSIKTQNSKGSLGCFLHFHILIWETYIQMCFHLSEEPAFPLGLYFSVSISTSGKQVLFAQEFPFHHFFFPPPFFSGLQLSSLLHLFRHCRNAQLLCCTIPSQWVLFFAPWLHSQSTISNHLYHFKRMRLPVPLLTTLQLFHASLWPRGSHIALWCCKPTAALPKDVSSRFCQNQHFKNVPNIMPPQSKQTHHADKRQIMGFLQF